MLRIKIERISKTEDKVLKAYEAYRKAVTDLLEETGWGWEASQLFKVKPEDKKRSDAFNAKLTEIDNKYNK